MSDKYGLVWTDGEEVWFGRYDNELDVKHFYPISDFNEIYDDLGPNKFSFVDVKDEGDGVSLRDICVFEISLNEGGDASIPEFLRSCGFPSQETSKAFEMFFMDGIASDKKAVLN